MAKVFPGPSDLYYALKAEGFDLPDECRDVVMVMPVDGVFCLRYEVFLYGDRLAQVGRALTKIGEGKVDRA